MLRRIRGESGLTRLFSRCLTTATASPRSSAFSGGLLLVVRRGFGLVASACCHVRNSVIANGAGTKATRRRTTSLLNPVEKNVSLPALSLQSPDYRREGLPHPRATICGSQSDKRRH